MHKIKMAKIESKKLYGAFLEEKHVSSENSKFQELIICLVSIF